MKTEAIIGTTKNSIRAEPGGVVVNHTIQTARVVWGVEKSMNLGGFGMIRSIIN